MNPQNYRFTLGRRYNHSNWELIFGPDSPTAVHRQFWNGHKGKNQSRVWEELSVAYVHTKKKYTHHFGDPETSSSSTNSSSSSSSSKSSLSSASSLSSVNSSSSSTSSVNSSSSSSSTSSNSSSSHTNSSSSTPSSSSSSLDQSDF